MHFLPTTICASRARVHLLLRRCHHGDPVLEDRIYDPVENSGREQVSIGHLMVGGKAEKGDAREGRDASGVEEEDDTIFQKFHSKVLSGKLRQAVRQDTKKEDRGYLLLDD